MQTNRLSLKIVSLLLFTLVFLGCKKPKSDFNLKQYEYVQGDALVYENLSINDKLSKWKIFNDNGYSQSFEGANPNLITGIISPDGIYTVRLTSYTKNEKKPYTTDRTFLLKSFKQTLIINNSGPGPNGQKDFDIYVDEQHVGHSSAFGQFVVEIPEGLRLVKLVSATKTKEETHDFNTTIKIDF